MINLSDLILPGIIFTIICMRLFLNSKFIGYIVFKLGPTLFEYDIEEMDLKTVLENINDSNDYYNKYNTKLLKSNVLMLIPKIVFVPFFHFRIGFISETINKNGKEKQYYFNSSRLYVCTTNNSIKLIVKIAPISVVIVLIIIAIFIFLIYQIFMGNILFLVVIPILIGIVLFVVITGIEKYRNQIEIAINYCRIK